MKIVEIKKCSNWDNVDKYVDNCFFDIRNCGYKREKQGMWIKTDRVFRQNDENE